jgi:hypothetical protein
MNSHLDAALRYARRGWFVYPSPAKAGPAHVKWGTESSNDPAVITKWWRKWPTALICLNCGASGIAAIDLDVKGGLNGPEALRTQSMFYGPIPRTLQQRTPSGGAHLLYHGTIKTTVGVMGEGIDTRGRGGMIVLAPSAGYKMLNDLEPVELPAWMAELAEGVVHVTQSVGPQGDGDFEPVYTDEEFAALLNLIPVERYDGDHDAWLELMLACSHSSTVANGKSSFMDWTLRDGPGNRIGYGSDADMIDARWEYNEARRDRRAALMVGTFHRHLLAAAPNAEIKSQYSAADDFAGVVEEPWTPPKKPGGYSKYKARKLQEARFWKLLAAVEDGAISEARQQLHAELAAAPTEARRRTILAQLARLDL